MQIRQLQIAHDALQDRLILRVATEADEEFRVWVTRRFLRELWPHLARLLDDEADNADQADDIESTVLPHNFEQAFVDDKAIYPLGLTPLLTSEVKCDTLRDGSCHLTFREGRERRFELGLTPDLLQALCAMLRAGAEQAHWDLVLDQAADKLPNVSHHPRPTHLH